MPEGATFSARLFLRTTCRYRATSCSLASEEHTIEWIVGVQHPTLSILR